MELTNIKKFVYISYLLAYSVIKSLDADIFVLKLCNANLKIDLAWSGSKTREDTQQMISLDYYSLCIY